MPIKMEALRDGFIDGKRVRAGSVFMLADGKKPGKWMQPVGVPRTAPAAPEPPPSPAPEPAPLAEAASGAEEGDSSGEPPVGPRRRKRGN